MARYLAQIKGSRGPASRLGGAASGIRARAQGWDLGVYVHGGPSADPETPERDRFEVYVTSGSNGTFAQKHLGTVYLETDGEPSFEPSVWAREQVEAFTLAG